MPTWLHSLYLFNPNTKYQDMYRIPHKSAKKYRDMNFCPALRSSMFDTSDLFPNGLQSFKTNDCFCGNISFWLFFFCFIRDRRDETENDRSVRDGTRKAPCDPGCKLGSLIFLYHFNISITLSSPVQIYLHAI